MRGPLNRGALKVPMITRGNKRTRTGGSEDMSGREDLTCACVPRLNRSMSLNNFAGPFEALALILVLARFPSLGVWDLPQLTPLLGAVIPNI